METKTARQKDQLIKLSENISDDLRDNWNQLRSTVSCFIKEEPYETKKSARAIVSTNDRMKIVSGVYWKEVERFYFSFYDHVTKHILSTDLAFWMATVKEKIGLRLSADATRNEKSFVIQMMQRLLKPVLVKMFDENIADAMIENDYGPHKRKFYYITAKHTRGYQHSGSSGTAAITTGVHMMLLCYYVCEVLLSGNGVTVANGDDGLAVTDVNLDLATVEHSFETFYSRLGFTIKLDDPDKTPFCQIVPESPVPTHRAPVLLVSPIRFLSRFGWVGAKYRHANDRTMKALARGKALSTLVLSNGCPIISTFCHRILFLTAGIKPNFGESNSYYSLRYVESPTYRRPITISDSSRSVMENMWGISIGDQLAAEEAIAKFEWGNFKLECLEHLFPHEYRDNWYEQVLNPRTQFNFNKSDLEELVSTMNSCVRESVVVDYDVPWLR